MKRDSPAEQGEFDLGGVRWPRPFRIRRLGHFGLNVADPERSKDWLRVAPGGCATSSPNAIRVAP